MTGQRLVAALIALASLGLALFWTFAFLFSSGMSGSEGPEALSLDVVFLMSLGAIAALWSAVRILIQPNDNPAPRNTARVILLLYSVALLTLVYRVPPPDAGIVIAFVAYSAGAAYLATGLRFRR